MLAHKEISNWEVKIARCMGLTLKLIHTQNSWAWAAEEENLPVGNWWQRHKGESDTGQCFDWSGLGSTLPNYSNMITQRQLDHCHHPAARSHPRCSSEHLKYQDLWTTLLKGQFTQKKNVFRCWWFPSTWGTNISENKLPDHKQLSGKENVKGRFICLILFALLFLLLTNVFEQTLGA